MLNWDTRWRQDDQRVRSELEQLRREQAEQHAASAHELDEQRRQFETEASQARAGLKKQQAQLDVREDVLREDREAFDLRVKQRAGAALEEAEAKYRDLEARLAAARKERDGLYERLREREEAERALGNRPLDEVKRELDALIKENKSLTDRLAKRPSEDMVARLEMLERAQEEWEADRARLSQELMASRASVARSAIAVTELESLRDQKAALETGRDLLQAALEELRKDVDERIRRSDGVSPFPSCSQMDGDDTLQVRVPMVDDIPDLAAFCSDLQNRVAIDPDVRQGLVLLPVRHSLLSRRHGDEQAPPSSGHQRDREDEPAPGLCSCPGCRGRPHRGAGRVEGSPGSHWSFQRLRAALLRVRVPAGALQSTVPALRGWRVHRRSGRDESLAPGAVLRRLVIGARARSAVSEAGSDDRRRGAGTSPASKRSDPSAAAKRLVRWHGEPRRDDQRLRGQDLRSRSRDGTAASSGIVQAQANEGTCSGIARDFAGCIRSSADHVPEASGGCVSIRGRRSSPRSWGADSGLAGAIAWNDRCSTSFPSSSPPAAP